MKRLFIVCLIALLSACTSPRTATSPVPASATFSPTGTATAPALASPTASPQVALARANPTASLQVEPTPAASPSPAPSRAVTVAPTGTTTASGSGLVAAQPSSGTIPSFSHVFVIVMENHEANQIVGNAEMPYLNRLAGQYARAGDYYGVSHPSLPNYLALIGGSTFGVTSDCLDCFVKADNLAAQLEKAGRSWKAYMEDMPQPCFTGAEAGNYAQRHNPFIYFDNIRTDPARCQKIVPLTQLQSDLTSGAVPDFAWITPNVCNDTHDCSLGTGDAWLQTWVSKILASPAWQQGGVLFILFDEGLTPQGCCQYAGGGHVDALVISPLARRGFVSKIPYDHYSFLRTVEESWNLPLLGRAASGSTHSMTDFFAK